MPGLATLSILMFPFKVILKPWNKVQSNMSTPPLFCQFLNSLVIPLDQYATGDRPTGTSPPTFLKNYAVHLGTPTLVYCFPVFV